MGQQQLLLLVLGVVIVGLAVVVGINAFNENRIKSAQDRYTELAVSTLGDVISWYGKPTTQGGGGARGDGLETLTLSQLGTPQDYDDGARTGAHINGVARFLFRAENPLVQIHADPILPGSPMVEVVAFGPSPDCFVSQRGVYDDTWTSFNEEAPANPDAANCSW